MGYLCILVGKLKMKATKKKLDTSMKRECFLCCRFGNYCWLYCSYSKCYFFLYFQKNWIYCNNFDFSRSVRSTGHWSGRPVGRLVGWSPVNVTVTTFKWKNHCTNQWPVTDRPDRLTALTAKKSKLLQYFNLIN